MKYVLDSSVAFKWLVPELDTDKALRLLDDYQKAIQKVTSGEFAREVSSYDGTLMPGLVEPMALCASARSTQAVFTASPPKPSGIPRAVLKKRIRLGADFQKLQISHSAAPTKMVTIIAVAICQKG